MAERRQDRSGEAGYNLVELGIMLTLIAIAAIAALPNLAGMTARNRLSDASRQVQQTVQRARMLAITERHNFVVAFSPTGFNLWSDDNSNGTRDTGEKWLHAAEWPLPAGVSYQSPPGNVDLAGESPVPASACRCLQFLPSGLVQVPGSTTISQYVDLGTGKDYRRVRLSTGGAVRVARWNPTAQKWD